MGVLDIFDPMIRGGAVALFLLWIAILWRDHRAAPASRVAIAMNVAIISYLLAHVLNPDGPTRFPYVIADALSVMVPALFWLFARLWFDDQQRIGWRSWALVGAFGLLPLVQIALITTAGTFSWALVGAFGLLPLVQIALITTAGTFSWAVWVLVRIGMFGFALAGMWIAWRGRANDLIEARRGFRLALVGAIGGFVIWVSFIEMFHNRDMSHDLARTLTLAAILIATFIISVGLYRFRSAELFAAPDPAAKPVARPAEPTALARRLHAVMAEERAYRAEGFSIAALAARLGEPEYRVRRAINGEMGYRNFTAFLNGFRLEEVRAALADPAQREVPILTIALDAGFGSLGPFNRAFRDSEAMTPSEYRAARLADSEIG
ncbi:MAG: helix-turn-helix transcriptional regulator [Sphingomonadales bacterium]|nr:helix-turn-helix transcriptional regulator [Sphingomonadales bacterium]